MSKTGVWASMAAGAAGGLVASYVMGQFTKWTGTPPRGGAQDATALAAAALARNIAGRELTLAQKDMGGQIVHFAFGAAMGALYGALRPGKWGFGPAFGAALYLGAHGWAVPKAGLSGWPIDEPLSGEAAELGAHLVYGAVTETVRRALVAAAL